MFWFAVCFFAVILALGVLIAAISAHFERRRTAQVAAYAEECGLRFSEALPPIAIEDRYNFPLFQLGRDGHAKNYLDATADGASICLFDYYYTTGGGKHKQTHVQTVYWSEGPRLNLPAFTLRPRSVFHRIGAWFGYRTIEIDQYPEFGRAYTLRGADETAIRDVFTPATVAVLLSIPTVYCLEAERTQFILYRAGRRAKVPELNDFLAHGYRVFKSLESDEQDAVAEVLEPEERIRTPRTW